jgi:hypothetical protein
MTHESMTRDQLSLLLYLESRAVDHGGIVDTSRMNERELQVARDWADDDFIRFGILSRAFARRDQNAAVELSKDAFAAAHAERRARAQRNLCDAARNTLHATKARGNDAIDT